MRRRSPGGKAALAVLGANSIRIVSADGCTTLVLVTTSPAGQHEALEVIGRGDDVTLACEDALASDPARPDADLPVQALHLAALLAEDATWLMRAIHALFPASVALIPGGGTIERFPSSG